MKKPKSLKIKVLCSFDRLIALEKLKENPKNPNKHSDSQIKLLAKAIQHHGWRLPIVVSKRSGLVVAGHGPLDDLNVRGLDWIIYGGESGPGYRAHDLAWPRAMRAKCAAAGVAFFFKQSSAARTEMGITLDGETVREFPTPRQT